MESDGDGVEGNGHVSRRVVEGNEDVWFEGQKTHRSVITISEENILSKRTCLFFTSLKSRKRMCVKGSGR